MTDPAPRPDASRPDPATSPDPRSPSSRRLITLAIVAVLVLAALATSAKLLQRSQIPLATNGVGVGAVIATMVEGQEELCLSDVVVPEGVGVMQLWVGYHDPRPVTLTGELKLRGGASIPVRPTVVTATGAFQSFPLATAVPQQARGVLCVRRSGDGPQVDVGGATISRRAGERPATIGGTSMGDVEPSLRMMAPEGVETSGFGRVPDAVRHLAALSPSGLPPLGILFVLVVLLPASLAVLLWNLVTAPQRSARRVAAWCVVASLGITTTWAVVTPIYQGPDESEHFAYAQHLALTGERADPGRSLGRPPYSTQGNAVYSVLRHNAVVIDRAARNPWTAGTQADINDTDDLPGNDGGGFTESASGHSALYYAIVSPAIKLAGDPLPRQLFFARLTTALMSALVAGLAAWAAALLVPGRRRVAALAGLAAATLPIAGSVGGTVNNDNLVNVVAAAAFVGVISLLTRPKGSVWRYAAVGALIAALPIAKITGLGVGAAFAGALLIAALLRRQPLAILSALLAGAGGVVAALGVLAVAGSLLVDGQTLTLFNVHPAVPGTAGVPVPLVYKIDYIVQLFVPFVHLKTDLYPPDVPLWRIYVLGTWGGFGWNRFYLPTTVNYALGALTVAGVVAGFVALARQRARVVQHKLAMLAVALTPLIAMVFVAYAYGAEGPRGVQPEQGRYITIALVPLSLWFAALPAVFGRGRVRSLMIGAVAAGLCAMAGIGLLNAIGGWAA